MKSSSKSIAMVSVLFVVSAGGCALIGYDLSGYGAAATSSGGDAGKGGGRGTEGEGGVGGSGGSGGGPSHATSSASSGADCPNDCDDLDACTQDVCAGGGCTNLMLTESDDNACTMDTCDKETGPIHIQLPDCCPHSLCKAGVPLNSVCTPPHIAENCISAVCSARSTCCTKFWDKGCIELVSTYCTGHDSTNTVITCVECLHSYCEIGPPLEPTCDPCVYAISVDRPLCTTQAWTAECVELTHSRCGIPREDCR